MRLSSIAGAAVLSAVFANVAPPAQAAQPTDIVFTAVDLAGGTVSGLIAGVPFQTDITFVQRLLPGNGRRCSVLHLDLAPIHISLLGLHVDTSEICLDITAFPNKGILGQLLCSLADGPLNLNALTRLEGLLTDVLNDALTSRGRGNGNGGGNGGGNGMGNGGGSVCSGECEVLDLVIGPVKLDLLGLRVVLDNCNNGPVEVCISATASEGLVGSLLCSLAGQGPLSLQNVIDAIAPDLALILAALGLH